MSGIWSVAKNTLTQCFRMKIAGVFVALMAVVLGVMPFTFARYGDGTLAGQIRTFLAYGLGATSFVLAIMTALVATNVTSSDVERKYVFTLAVKPLPRWQYVVGRWLGVFLLNAMLLTVAMLFVYAMVQRMRAAGPAAGASDRLVAEDRRAVETEIFVARGKVQAEWGFNFEALVAGRIAEKKANGAYDRMLAQATEDLGSGQDAVNYLERMFREWETISVQSVGPGQATAWAFSGLDVEGWQKQAQGKIAGVSAKQKMVYVEAPYEILSRLIYMGPVRVDDGYVMVTRLRKTGFEAMVDPSIDVAAAFKPGQSVRLTAEPTVQIRYELGPTDANKASGATYRVAWTVENPQTGLRVTMPREDPGFVPQTLTVSAKLVSSDGRLRVTFANLARGVDIVVQRSNVTALYPVSGFELNFFKGGLLLLCRLGFVSALGIALGAFLSFPVAALVELILLLVSMAAGFLEEAVKMPKDLASFENWVQMIGHYSRMVLMPVSPNFEGTSPTEALTAGTVIPWDSLAAVGGVTVLGHTLMALLAGVLLYQWRELARVQV
jgi:hypothetical protein